MKTTKMKASFGVALQGLPYTISSELLESIGSNCKNCAAPLNWHKEQCEYCDTFFVRRSEGYALSRIPLPNNQTALGVCLEAQQKPSIWDNILQGGLGAALCMLPRGR